MGLPCAINCKSRHPLWRRPNRRGSVNDPQLNERGFIVEVENQRLGKVVLPSFPLHFANAKLTRRWEFPVLGKDTETVLRDIVGYDAATIRAHKLDGVLE
jgi:crotonobetainyl-CoA:carnitine CoA-transferase CaiB-like acyl-CoA transferase